MTHVLRVPNNMNEDIVQILLRLSKNSVPSVLCVLQAVNKCIELSGHSPKSDALGPPCQTWISSSPLGSPTVEEAARGLFKKRWAEAWRDNFLPAVRASWSGEGKSLNQCWLREYREEDVSVNEAHRFSWHEQFGWCPHCMYMDQQYLTAGMTQITTRRVKE